MRVRFPLPAPNFLVELALCHLVALRHRRPFSGEWANKKPGTLAYWQAAPGATRKARELIVSPDLTTRVVFGLSLNWGSPFGYRFTSLQVFHRGRCAVGFECLPAEINPNATARTAAVVRSDTPSLAKIRLT